MSDMLHQRVPQDPSDRKVGELVKELQKLSPEDRLEVMVNFCLHCGTDDLPCHCWNDE